MSDFGQKFGQGLDRMQHQGGSRPAPVPQASPVGPSSWHMLAEALGFAPQAAASQDVPGNHVPPTQAAPIDGFQNLNNRIQGKPYR